VAGDTLLIGATGADTLLYAMNTDSGAIRWQFIPAK
jgi:hypothetical protein